MINVSKMTVAELEAEKQKTSSAIQDAAQITADLNVRLEAVTRELSKRLKPSPEPRVSDHALFRYIERVYNIDLESIRAEILTDRAKEALKMGATGYTSNGVKFKAKNGVLITVIN